MRNFVTSGLTLLTAILILAVSTTAAVPSMFNYQGYLQDSGGNPINGTVGITFSICADSVGSSCNWTEFHPTVTVTDGQFNVKLGSITPIIDNLLTDPEKWLGIIVGGESLPYTQLVSVPFAHRVSTVDGATGGEISGKLNVGYSNTNAGEDGFVVGKNSDVTGQGATVTGGWNHSASAAFSTISGGWQHTTSADYATVGGGRYNNVTASAGTIAGGWVNTINEQYAAIGGGAENTASGWYSVIGGGWKNSVQADYSAILGGLSDTITSTAEHSFLFGIGSKLTADSTFMVDMPHIRFGDEATGYEFPSSDGSASQVLATNGSGQLSWTTGGSGGGGGWTDDGAVVRLDASTDEVGVGTTTPDAKLHVESAQEHAGRFTSSVGTTDSAVFTAEYLGGGDVDAVAVRGISRPNDYWGIGGRFEGNYIGVEGKAFPGGTSDAYAYVGMVGEARGGIARNEGVRGIATNCWGATGTSGTAINGSEWTIGVSGSAYNSSAPTSTGVFGASVASGSFSYGVTGFAIDSPSTWSYGVYGQAHSSPTGNIGVGGSAQLDQGWKRGGDFTASGTGTNYGAFGYAYGGTTNYSVYGTSAGNSAPTHYAGYFQGDVHVNGTLSKSSGSFKIDHPVDPENKYLQHSFIESPDMMNVYNGNVATDADGRAVVELPDYFETLNTDFRYQLTVIGQFAQAIIEQEIEGNRFIIATDQPNVKVSWQVTGVRQDPWAEAHPIEVEVDKLPFEQGKYLNPELYGYDKGRAIHSAEEVPQNEQIPELTKQAIERDKK